MVTGMVRAGPVQQALHCSKSHLPAIKQPVQGSFDKFRRDRHQIEQRPSPAGDGNGTEVCSLRRIEPPRPPNDHTRKRRCVTLRDENLHSRPLELAEPPHVSGTPMRGETSSSQAGRHHIASERCRGPSQDVDAGMGHEDGTIVNGPEQLALGKPSVEPLVAGEQAVLAGRPTHQRIDDGRVRPEPERITHAERR